MFYNMRNTCPNKEYFDHFRNFTIFWSFQRFQGNIGHFRGLRIFWSFQRFQGILVILRLQGYFGCTDREQQANPQIARPIHWKQSICMELTEHISTQDMSRTRDNALGESARQAIPVSSTSYQGVMSITGGGSSLINDIIWRDPLTCGISS